MNVHPPQPPRTAPVLRPAISLFLALTLLTGILYPLSVTGVARLLFPRQAQGSILMRGGHALGSDLIGQSFTDPGHFWSRPSASAPQPYNGSASGGSNLGPLNPALIEAIRTRLAALRAADPGNSAPVPVDLVAASASGLDPHISVAAASYQAGRVARARGIAAGRVRALIAAYTEGRLFGVIGEPRVNVLRLNLALDTLK